MTANLNTETQLLSPNNPFALSQDSLDRSFLKAPTPKKRKIAENQKENVTNTRGWDSRRNSAEKSEPSNTDGTPICCLWLERNPGTKPCISGMRFLSLLSHTTFECIERFFTLRTGLEEVPCYNKTALQQQQMPGDITLSALDIWQRKNPGQDPTEFVLGVLEFLFHDSYESIRNWLIRSNAETPRTFEDSGLGKTATKSNTTTQEMDITSPRPRKHCSPNSWVNDTTNGDFKKSTAKPFLCVLCGAIYSTRAAWRKHEANNWLPKSWHCVDSPCNRFWAQEEELQLHVIKNHTDIAQTMNMSCQKHNMRNFRRRCVFNACDDVFESFDDCIHRMGNCFKHRDYKFSDLRNDSGEMKIFQDDDPTRDRDADSDEPDNNNGGEGGPGSFGNVSQTAVPTYHSLHGLSFLV